MHYLAAHALKGDDCDRLFKFLRAAAPSWGKIANKLNFSYDEKTAITHTPGLNGDEDYFQALLHRWLKREPHLTTVEVLANALRLADEHKLAYDLETTEGFPDPTTRTTWDSTKTDTASLANLLGKLACVGP